MLDFRIATFLQLCETRSYTKTARILGMTQPSVTQHIKHLQKQFGCTLFTYEGKTLRLTPEGEYLRRQAESMTKMSKRTAADLRRMSEQNAVMRFGIPTELGEAWTAAVTASLMQQSPDLRLRLVTGSSTDLVQKTETGELDFVLTDKLCASAALASTALGKVRFGCYAASSVAETPMHVKRLVQQCLLLREEQCCDRLAAELLLSRKNLTPDDFAAVWTSNSAAALRQMTAAGQGVCFAYATAMPDGDGAPVMLPVSDLSDERTLVFLYRKDAAEQTRFKAFFEDFKNEWNAAAPRVQ